MATANLTRLRIGPADDGRPMTIDEFLDAEEEEGYRYELGRGVLEVSEVPDDDHGEIVSAIYMLLAAYNLAYPGRIRRIGGGSEFRLWMREMVSGRNPDVAVVLAGTPPDHRGRRPPSLAMEIVSEGGRAWTRDYVTKRQEYLAYGLREYWILDPLERRIVVLIRHGDTWIERVFGANQEAEGVLLPGFRVGVAALFPAAAD